ncbi:putative disease resistance protein RGA3 [Hevea brasiliensis]|uniref:putative disease resistance protein RGA3 n=1 Tax=Hevea brasiliensis TaxID=3981 RepID=UPI0025EA1D87|nr:putative disease resistance protein RGA3 [Hevea brasiliensis]
MAETLVSIALQQLAKIMEEQVKLVTGVEEDVRTLKSNLQSIQGVLVEAEKKQFENVPIKQWLDNLKDVSYAIDDVLDEWSTAIVRAQTEEDDFSHSWFESQLLQFPFLRQVCSFLPINSCFACTEFGNRYEIARKIKKLNARLDDIAKERKRYTFKLTEGNEEVNKPLVVTSAIDVAEVKGREQDKTAIKKMLMVESGNRSNLQLQVVSIAGIGGLGKTTLAKLVYNDKDVEKYFENRVWVSVSKPFDEVKIAKSILEILTDAASFFNEFETIMQHIQKLVKGKRFLLVLDDVWEDGPSKWERMRDSFTSASLGSSILLTTRDMSVPGNMGCRRDCLFKLGKLSLEDCWSIFSEIAFFQKNNEERGRLEAIGREIVEKCDGLPMAAKTLACLLRSKQSWKEWQSVLDSEVWELDGLWEKGSETQSGFASLWLSYYNMVSELRPCFSYCSIFPKDHEIKKDVLIQLWMAQGYLRQTPAEDMERIGEKYFQNLAAFSFFEELKKDDYGNIISCKMYNIVHDFAKYIRKNECLSIKVDGGEELRTDSLGKEVRHLRVMLGKEVSFPSSIYRLKNLRSLWVQSKGNSMIGAALPNLFSGLTCLRTLNLSNCNIVEIPSTISKLIHLRQIDLSYNKELKELPETLCELYNLQTLNISWCVSLVKLPRGIEKLINLRHLNNGGFEGVLPKGIRRLSCLRSLDRFGIGHDGEESCTLGDMKGLNSLQGYFCIRGLENVADVDEGKQAELKKKTEVSPLELRFGKGDAEWRKSHDGELLDALEPPPYVQELRVYDYQGSTVFPTWMISLTSLKTLLLTNCKACQHLPPLGQLPSLEFLRIWGMDGIKKVGPEFLGTETQSALVVAFPRLIKLRFVRMRNLEGWADEFSIKRTIMPRLRTLSFAWCPKLKAVPDQMLGKATLQELIFTCSPILKQRYQKGTGEDWHKISHIPNIKVWNFGEKRFLKLLEERGLILHS